MTESINTVILLDEVKTAVSIPDDLFQAAEAAAKRLGISRRALYDKIEKYGLSKP